jgi:hypothetical protein
MRTGWTRTLLAVTLLLAGTALADAQKKATVARPVGTWTRTIDQFTITFDIQADGMKIILKADTNQLTAHADYSITKDGSVLFARMHKIERQGIEDGPAEGDLFSFKFKVNGAEMSVDDLQGKVNDEARRIVQGVYKKEKK